MVGKPRYFLFKSVALAGSIAAALAACGGEQAKKDKTFVRGARHADIELPQLEIHSDGVDRFSRCPASGGAVQGWVPKVPEWTGAAAKVSPAASAVPSSSPAIAVGDAGTDGAAKDFGDEEISI